MKKILGLVFEDTSNIMDETFESVRKEFSLSKDEFEKILKKEKGQELFKSFDETITDFSYPIHFKKSQR